MCRPEIVKGLSVFNGGVLSTIMGGDDCVVVLLAKSVPLQIEKRRRLCKLCLHLIR